MSRPAEPDFGATKIRSRTERPKKSSNPLIRVAVAIGLVKPPPRQATHSYDDRNMSALERDFLKAANKLETIKDKIEYSEWLLCYALYKQATIGDCNIVKPSGLFKKKLAKYTAWRSRLGMPTGLAAKEYVELVHQHYTRIETPFLLNDANASLPAAAVQLSFPRVKIKAAAQQKSYLQSSGLDSPATMLEYGEIAESSKRDRPTEDSIQRILKPSGRNAPARPRRPPKTVEKPPKKTTDHFPFYAANGKYDRGRASMELNLFLSTKSSNRGMAYQEIEKGSAEFEEMDAKLFGETNENPQTKKSLENPVPTTPGFLIDSKKKSSVFFGRQQSAASRSSIRSRFHVTEGEYRRYTTFKMNTTVVSSRMSFMSFVKPDYAYRGKSLAHMVQDGQKANDPILGQSHLLSNSGNDKRYKDVLAVVHLVKAEYQRELDNGPVEKQQEEFNSKKKLKVPLDSFLFRLVRYLDRWFEDPPGINSAGARSMVISRIYVNRLKANMDDFHVTKLNVCKLLSVCMLLAAKYCEDCIIANAYWAQVAGISVEELNKVEEVFCNATHFDLYVQDQEMEQMSNKYNLFLNNKGLH